MTTSNERYESFSARRIPELPRDERRSGEPLRQLSRELDAACIHALQPQELAAILESQGYTDALVWERFQEHTVFACAEKLFAMVPYRPALVSAPLLSPLPRTLWQELIRGVIYLLPALWCPAALALGWGEGATVGLLVASLFGWGWMQSAAYLGYAGLAASRRTAGRLLRGGGAAAVLLTGALAALIAHLAHQDALHVTVIAVAVATYLAAATTLLVLGRELLLLLSLLPALALSALHFLRPNFLHSGLGFPGSEALAPWTLPAVILTLAAGLPLLAALRASDLRAPTRLSVLPRARDLVPRSLPFALYGWLCAAFLTLGLMLSGGANLLSGNGWSLAPLVLSMGAMEVTVRRIHEALHRETRSRDSIREIVSRSVTQVMMACLGYGALLLALYDALVWLAPSLDLPRPPLLLLAGHVQVAVAMLLSGLLINFGLLPRTLLLWTLAVLAQVLLTRNGYSASASYALSSSVLLALLLLGTSRALSDIRNLS
ncbi:hypothetical protein [Deinococcus sp.]|uniref:hypothetical protein n=1 Tax=Deinococcus sp. TaxID=47478 RepID=UPI003CC5B562